jgi:hypothetical protein
MSLRQRLRRLADVLSRPASERCPRCPRVAVVYYRQYSWEGEAVLQQGERLPALCAGCERPVELLAVVEDKYFFQRRD